MKKPTPAARRLTLSDFVSARVRVSTSFHPRGGICVGRSASRPRSAPPSSCACSEVSELTGPVYPVSSRRYALCLPITLGKDRSRGGFLSLSLPLYLSTCLVRRGGGRVT